jgi:tRNA pseudouridine synthase 10
MKRIGEKRFKPNLGLANHSYVLDRGNINDIIKNSSNEIFYKIYKNVIDTYEDIGNLLEIRIEAVNENILLKGNYIKYSREIGQTPWSHGGVKICYTSVQEEMSKTLNKIFEAPESILHAGGREDRDVRMLGSGRPFIIEVVNPKKRKM